MKTMTTKNKLIAAVLSVVALGGIGAAGIANAESLGMNGAETERSEAQEDAAEARMLASTTITASDAARIAAEHTGLKVAEVELDDEAATPAWEVSVGSGADEQEVKIDGTSGKVLSVQADDEGDENGEQDDD
ncbi:PepSY domain-containing protein [Qipengyuania sp. YG27]|uniref:PepSY domain-containing protein n=1 Tax=Qipengyuania mesophila TaxID=2867246 RepID=A0ABS7JWW9_9SPHN|nr:PepSY domain-containing protein [Qipengyuania mesophila]MBX7502156.1 PepSY domain-containing protein [Qipengyuania mesophila]